MHKMQFRAFLMIELAAALPPLQNSSKKRAAFQHFYMDEAGFFSLGRLHNDRRADDKVLFCAYARWRHRKILGIIIGNNELVFQRNGWEGPHHACSMPAAFKSPSPHAYCLASSRYLTICWYRGGQLGWPKQVRIRGPGPPLRFGRLFPP